MHYLNEYRSDQDKFATIGFVLMRRIQWVLNHWNQITGCRDSIFFNLLNKNFKIHIYLKIYMHSNVISRHPVIGIRWFRIHWIRHVETNPMICVSSQTDKYSARYSRYCQITDLLNLIQVDLNIQFELGVWVGKAVIRSNLTHLEL